MQLVSDLAEYPRPGGRALFCKVELGQDAPTTNPSPQEEGDGARRCRAAASPALPSAANREGFSFAPVQTPASTCTTDLQGRGLKQGEFA